ncbi:unnamed protein product, partial [Phaeothamnion confervicola]
EKSIRRRVYDALNVLMALDIIVKDKKMITWQGKSRSTVVALEAARRAQQEASRSVEGKRSELQELVVQYLALQNLALRH